MRTAARLPHFSTPFASPTNADMLPDFLNTITDDMRWEYCPKLTSVRFVF